MEHGFWVQDVFRVLVMIIPITDSFQHTDAVGAATVRCSAKFLLCFSQPLVWLDTKWTEGVQVVCLLVFQQTLHTVGQST